MCVLHVKGRGAGGDDRENILAACWQHYVWQTRIGFETFARILGLDLEAEAVKLDMEYQRRGAGT